MKALLVSPGPFFSVQDVFEGWAEGLAANGVQVSTFNMHDRLQFYTQAELKRRDEGVEEYRRCFDEEGAARAATGGLYAHCYGLLPDVVIVTSGFFVAPEAYRLIRARGAKVVLLDTEAPYEIGRTAGIARDVDMVVTNDPVAVDAYRQVTQALYIPHGYRPDRHCPGPVDPLLSGDVGFVGTGYPSRIDLLEAVDWTGLDLRLGGMWQGVEDDSPLRKALVHDPAECFVNADTVRLYHSVKVGLNLYRREHQDGAHANGWAMGPREVEMAACGTFFLRDRRPESDGVLGMLPTVSHDPQELGEQLRWWTSHDVERQRLAEKARAAVADRTFTNTTAMFLRHFAA